MSGFSDQSASHIPWGGETQTVGTPNNCMQPDLISTCKDVFYQFGDNDLLAGGKPVLARVKTDFLLI